jgi:hypothetical protein
MFLNRSAITQELDHRAPLSLRKPVTIAVAPRIELPSKRELRAQSAKRGHALGSVSRRSRRLRLGLATKNSLTDSDGLIRAPELLALLTVGIPVVGEVFGAIALISGAAATGIYCLLGFKSARCGLGVLLLGVGQVGKLAPAGLKVFGFNASLLDGGYGLPVGGDGIDGSRRNGPPGRKVEVIDHEKVGPCD